MQKNKVIAAISGGVDSAVAAGMLIEQGFDVTAVFLCHKIHNEGTGGNRSCCSPQDAADARKIAYKLGIKFEVLSVSDEFENIVQDFVADYENGLTPNPCIWCNERVKFKKLLELADSFGARYIATGHYARIIHQQNQYVIARALAAQKDQSYVLFSLTQEWLNRILFPVGYFQNKEIVRQMAQRFELNVYDKPDSQDICFVPDGDYTSLLEKYGSRALTAGDIIGSGGKILGRHNGYGRFTIGQRRGIRISAKIPLYVTGVNPKDASVTVGSKEELLADGLYAHRANWQLPVSMTFDAAVKVRYAHKPVQAAITIQENGCFEVNFKTPVSAVTPGQAVVVYKDDVMLGGGWIKSAFRNER